MAFLHTSLLGGDLTIPLITAAPTEDGTKTGELRLQIGPNSRVNLWRWGGSAWVCAAVSPIVGAGDPNGIYTGEATGQGYYSTADDSHWFFNGSLWKQTAGGGPNGGGGEGGW